MLELERSSFQYPVMPFLFPLTLGVDALLSLIFCLKATLISSKINTFVKLIKTLRDRGFLVKAIFLHLLFRLPTVETLLVFATVPQS